MALMYLNLPGFPTPEKRLHLGKTRIEELTKGLAKTSPSPEPKRYKFKSNDIDDRISWIEYEINVGKRTPGIRQIAADALREVPPRQWKKEAAALYDYTRQNVRYTLDPHGVELFQSAARSSQIGIGDCDDQSIFLSSLLQAVGIPVRLRVIGLKGQRKFQHIYVLAGLPPSNPSEWFPLDPSRDEGAGWELPESERGLLRDYDVDDFDPEEEEDD